MLGSNDEHRVILFHDNSLHKQNLGKNCAQGKNLQ